MKFRNKIYPAFLFPFSIFIYLSECYRDMCVCAHGVLVREQKSEKVQIKKSLKAR